LHRTTALAACLLPAALLAQHPAPAAPPPQKKEEPRQLEKIEVQADGLAERRESTASKIIINSEEITRYGDTNVLDVLKRLPGVTVDSGPGGRGGAVRMRGLGTGFTQILVNGERMPPGFTLDSIAPDMIDRIEIVRGATAEFSTQSIAGTINVVLKRALSQTRRELKAGASMQHDKPTFNASGQWADRAGNLSYTIPFHAVRFSFVNEGFNEQRSFDPDGNLMQYFDSRRRNEGWGANGNLAPRLSWNLGKGHTFNLDSFLAAGMFRGHFIEDNTPVSGPPPPYVSTDLRLANENMTFRTNANYVRRWDDASRIDAKAGYTFARFDAGSGFDAYDVTGVQTLRRTVDSQVEDHGVSSQGKYTFPVTTGHNLSAGWDGALNQRADVRLQQDLNPATGLRETLDENFDTDIGRMAFYVQDEWDVTERFAVYLGVRWEGIETRSEGNTYDAIRNRSSVASPIVNLLWKLPGTQKDQVRLGLSRTYKPPGIGELVPRRFFAPNNSPTTPDFIGNPALRPELSWGLDAGYEHYPAGGGNLSVTLFHRRIEDIVQREVLLEDGLYISRPANFGKGSAYGIEFDAKGKLSQLWAGAPAVDLRLNFAINRSEVDYIPGPHNRLDNQVPWNGTFGFDYRFDPKLTVGSSFTARAGGTVRPNLTQELYSSATRQLEMYALWRFSPAVQLRLSVQDILAQDQVQVNRVFADDGGLTERGSIDPRFRRFSFLWEFKL
jgi:outer membrane receptor for ferrienterochelin and colicins